MTRRLHNRDAEAAVLAAVMLKGDEALDRVELEPEEFFDLKTREVYSAMLRLRDRSEPVGDPECVAEELGDMLEPCGGRAYLGHLLVNVAVTADNVDHYAGLVRKTATTRRAVQALSDLQAGSEEGDDLLARIGEVTAGLASKVADPSVTMADAVKTVWTQALEAMKGGAPTGISTGFDAIDNIGKLRPGVIMVLAGRPSQGKSALARSIASNVVAQGYGAHVFTPEDVVTTYVMREMADRARVDLHRVVSAQLQRRDLAPLTSAGGELRNCHHWRIDDSSGISARDIALRVRKHKQANNTRLVVVDYVQLLRDPQAPAHDDKAHVNLSMTGLAKIARDEGIAVLALSQLNRSLESRTDKRPIMSDLRESGKIEQDADSILFVYRDETYNPDSEDKGITEVIFRKNKSGRLGTARLAWDAPTATHRPLALRGEDGQW